MLPQLQFIDGERVTAEDREAAREEQQRRIDEAAAKAAGDGADE